MAYSDNVPASPPLVDSTRNHVLFYFHYTALLLYIVQSSMGQSDSTERVKACEVGTFSRVRWFRC